MQGLEVSISDDTQEGDLKRSEKQDMSLDLKKQRKESQKKTNPKHQGAWLIQSQSWQKDLAKSGWKSWCLNSEGEWAVNGEQVHQPDNQRDQQKPCLLGRSTTDKERQKGSKRGLKCFLRKRKKEIKWSMRRKKGPAHLALFVQLLFNASNNISLLLWMLSTISLGVW